MVALEVAEGAQQLAATTGVGRRRDEQLEAGHRVVLACLPAFIELADLLKNRLWFLVVVVGFALAQFVLLNRQIHWLFAG